MSGNIKTILWGALFLLTGGLFLGGSYLGGGVQGTAFLFLLALAFIGVAMRVKRSWMAIIPAGLFASLGVCAVLENVIPHQAYPALQNTLVWGVFIWVLFLGLAATFGVVWLLRKTQHTDWAKYPAAGLLALTVLAFMNGARFQGIVLEALALSAGVTVLLMVFDGIRMVAGQHPPKVKA